MKSDYHVYCEPCKSEISVQYGGRDDCRRHVNSAKHRDNARRVAENTDVRTFFSINTEQLNVTRAEIAMVNFLIEHNLPLAAADHATSMFNTVFVDSKIAKNFACRRTKATNVLYFLAEKEQKALAEKMRAQPFTLATDGSHDRQSDTQLYPIVVRLYDASLGRITDVVLSIPSCTTSCTGENIFHLLNDALTTRNIPWSNCIAFESDSASVMIGRFKGVAAFVKKEQPTVYIQGCMCHLIHIAAERAAHVLPVSAEELLIDIYYYLEKSTKRIQELKQCQVLCGVETHKILKHVTTRWLSLGICIKRLLEQWEPLSQFVRSMIPKPKAASNKRSSSVKDSVSELPAKHAKCSSTASAKTNESTKRNSTASTAKTSESAKRTSSTSTAKTPESAKRNSTTSTAKTSESVKRTSTASTAKTSESAKHTSTTSSAKTPESAKRNSTTSTAKTSESAKRTSTASTAKTSESAKSNSAASVTRIERLNVALQNPVTKVYILFLSHTIPAFDDFNKLLQKEEPVIHILKKQLHGVYNELLVRFVTPQAIAKAKTVFDVDYSCRENQKDRCDLIIGASTKQLISELKATQLISTSELRVFYTSVRQYFSTALDYIKDKFPFNDELLHHAQVIDIDNRADAKFSSVEYFVNRFPCLLKGDEGEKDDLELEFVKYQVDAQISHLLPASIDRMWSEISHMIDAATGRGKYTNLSRVMLGLLVIAHSNAQSERVFSLVRKNRTEYRPTLTDKTLEAMLIHKVNMSVTGRACYEQEYSKELLSQAKKATYQALSSHRAGTEKEKERCD